MATNDWSSTIGGKHVVDKRNIPDANNPMSAASTTAAASQATMDARLTALNGTYYTAAQLQTMNWNDKIYALRLISESAGI